MNTVESILAAFKSGEIDIEIARQQIEGQFYQDLGHSTLDLDRQRRTGASEVIYGEYKTPEQIVDKLKAQAAQDQNVLVTRVSPEKYAVIGQAVPEAEFHEQARLIALKLESKAPRSTAIAVVTAGTSDFSVAEEAAVTAEFFDNPVLRISDVGVAGIHRLLAKIDEIRQARVVVVVAGMEGALPSVVSGLIDKPVIAVPTSIGYGASFKGITALLSMLNSCATGVSVVNIDNGFGAGFLASQINAL
ncbi:MAG: nickel pincer cofactor biosynthesis protein LarB [Pseudomonadales bacterium]|nr:nickel pincer cofactor biosynthesis protein LarB [Pseudomonadales bacterium]